MTRRQLIVEHVPVNGPMQLIKVQELIETSDAPLRNFTWIIDVQAIDRRIEPGVRSTSKSIEILDAEQFKRLLKKRVIVERENVRATKIAVTRFCF